MSDSKLVYMANQIAAFFATQPGDGPKQTAAHLRAFWTVDMRKAILAYVERAGGAGLHPMALDAVRLLRAPEPSHAG